MKEKKTLQPADSLQKLCERETAITSRVFKTQGRAHRPFTAVNIWVIILDCIDLSLMLGSS